MFPSPPFSGQSSGRPASRKFSVPLQRDPVRIGPNRVNYCQLILPADVPLRRRFNAGLHLPIDATLGKSSSYGVAMKTETEVASPQRDICGHLRTSEKCAGSATFLNQPLARRLSARMPVQVTTNVLSIYLVGKQACAVLMSSFEAKWAFATLALQCQIYKVYRHSRRRKKAFRRARSATHATIYCRNSW